MKIVMAGRGPYDYAMNAAKGWGGAEKQQWLLARELVERGHEVVITVLTNEPDTIQPEIDGVRFVTRPNTNLVREIWHVFQEEKPDWYYWRSAQAFFGPTVLLAHMAGVRTIYSCAFDMDCIPHKALTRRKKLWYLYKLGLDRTNRIFVQHKNQMQLLTNGYRGKASQVNNIVEMPHTVLPEQGYVSWVSAAFRTPKRPDLMIEIARTMPDVRFVVCGAPTSHRATLEYGEAIVQQLKALPNVDYRGHVTPQEAFNIIAQSRVMLSTSEAEGFPNTMLEAWSGKTPVVALGVDPGDVIVEHKTGYVTETVEQATEKLYNLLNDPVHRQQIGINGYNYVANNHSKAHVYDQFTRSLGVHDAELALA